MDYLLVVAIRLIVPVAILKRPLPTFVALLQIDRLDWEWLRMGQRTEWEQQFYQFWDKWLDTYALALAAVTVCVWKDRLARRVALAAFAFRVVGVLIFTLSSNRTVFILVPNVFERIFLLYLVYRLVSKRDVMFRSVTDVWLVMPALLIPKVFEEYLNHAVGSRPWHTDRLLPPGISTPRTEYWTWMAILWALPAAALTRLLLVNRSRAGVAGRRTGVVPRAVAAGRKRRRARAPPRGMSGGAARR